MRVDWTEKQIKELQKRLNVWPSGNLEHETWAALVKALDMVVEPQPQPGVNPYYIKDHLLYLDGRQVNYKQSPNHGGVITPELIVIHYTGDNSLQGALSWLTRADSKVSAHLVIAKTGQVWQLLPFNVRGWHAGASSWQGRSDCNSWSIGIENVGLGDEWPEAQVQANIDIVAALADQYGIEEAVGHSDVAPGRKVDPGPLYPWDRVWGEES